MLIKSCFSNLKKYIYSSCSVENMFKDIFSRRERETVCVRVCACVCVHACAPSFPASNAEENSALLRAAEERSCSTHDNRKLPTKCLCRAVRGLHRRPPPSLPSPDSLGTLPGTQEPPCGGAGSLFGGDRGEERETRRSCRTSSRRKPRKERRGAGLAAAGPAFFSAELTTPTIPAGQERGVRLEVSAGK